MEKTVLIAAAQKRSLPLNLGGDGRADSPGNSAKFGLCSVIDLDQNKVKAFCSLLSKYSLLQASGAPKSTMPVVEGL